MASLGSLLHLLVVSLLNPVSNYLSYGPHESHNPPLAAHDHRHNALFVFGDSLFDAGNNQYLSTAEAGDAGTIWPYGETFFHHPTGRNCDGRLVPDFISKFAKLPILPPYLQPGPHNFTQGTNFASATAGILYETNPDTLCLPMQLYNFKAMNELLQEQLGDVKAKSLLGRAVYLISMGGNDYVKFYSDNPNATESEQQQVLATVLGNLTTVLKEIYDLGGRKFAFQNVAPVGCTPYVKQVFGSDGCVQELSDLTSLHNTALASVLEELEIEQPGFKYAIFDYYSAIEDRVNNPATYGFLDGTDACCGSGAYQGDMTCGKVANGTDEYELCSNPGDYLWFDGAHTTERANQQLAELLWSGTPNITGPIYNVKQLFEDQ